MTRADFYLRFIQTLMIRNKDAQLQPLTLWEPQRLVWNQYLVQALNARKPVRLLILKARQMGISTMIEALIVSKIVWENLVHGKIIAHEAESTKAIWAMAERMVEQSHFTRYARKAGTSMHLGDSILSCATAGSPHATRSQQISCLHLSEVAFWQHPEAWIAALQTVPLRGDSWLFVESTANGKVGDGKLFYDEWQRDDSPFTKIFLPWHCLDEYKLSQYVYADDWTDTLKDKLVLTDLDTEEMELRKSLSLSAAQLAWRREIIREKARGKVEWFHQEYPSTAEDAFIQSGLPLFNMAQLYPFRSQIEAGRRFKLEKDGRFVADPQGYVTIWRRPEVGHEYVIAADPSLGISDAGHSSSAAEILDMETMEQVGEYESSCPPHVLAQHLAILGHRYNEAMICPEVQSSGGGGGRELIVYLLKDHHYYHLHRWKHPDHVQVDPGRMWGWETNSRTRPRMIARVQEVIHEKSCVIHSEKLLTQLASFGLSDENRYEATVGKDDLFFAFGIALMSRSENYYKEMAPTKQATWQSEDMKRLGIAIKPDLSQAIAEEWDEEPVANVTKSPWAL